MSELTDYAEKIIEGTIVDRHFDATIYAAPDDADIWEVPVTSYVAGAHLLGKKARYIKIERNLSKPDSLHLQAVKVYGESE